MRERGSSASLYRWTLTSFSHGHIFSRDFSWALAGAEWQHISESQRKEPMTEWGILTSYSYQQARLNFDKVVFRLNEQSVITINISRFRVRVEHVLFASRVKRWEIILLLLANVQRELPSSDLFVCRLWSAPSSAVVYVAVHKPFFHLPKFLRSMSSKWVIKMSDPTIDRLFYKDRLVEYSLRTATDAARQLSDVCHCCFRFPDSTWKVIFLLLYSPVGILLALIRMCMVLQAFVAATLLRSQVSVRRLALRYE